MRKLVFLALFALLASCTAESIQDETEFYSVDKTKIERPGEQGTDGTTSDVDKTKVERPGSQGGS